MKANHIKITNRTAMKLPCVLAAFITAFLGLSGLAQGQATQTFPFWDGPDTTGDGVIDGGSGNWDNFTTNWTDSSGAANFRWLGDTAVFDTTGGTVIVMDVISFSSLEFRVGGYQIDATTGNSLQLEGAPVRITTDPGVTATITAPITGVGQEGIIKLGVGTLVLSGSNTYTATTEVNAGILMAGIENTLPSQTALTVLTGATFDLNNFAQSIGSLAGDGSVTLGTATLTTGNDNTSTIFSGTISGAGGLAKAGTGILTLTGANTYTGATTVNGGALVAGAINTLPSQTALTVAIGATVDLSFIDAAQSIGSLAGDGSLVLGAEDGMLTTGNDNTSTNFSGTISGFGALTKVGTGTQTLSVQTATPARPR
jgi:autotransporter-associated beta strand protein